MTESLYGTFHSRYGIDVVSLGESLDSVSADDGPASLLGQPEGVPLFRSRRVSSDALGRAAEKSEDLFIPSKIRFAMHSVGYVRLSATSRSKHHDGNDENLPCEVARRPIPADGRIVVRPWRFHRAIPLSCGFSDDWGCGSKSSDSSLLSILNALILCEKESFYHYRRYRCWMGHSYASKCCRYGKRIV